MFWHLVKHQMNQKEYKIGVCLLFVIQLVAFLTTCMETTSYNMQHYKDASVCFSLNSSTGGMTIILLEFFCPLIVTLLCAVNRRREEQTKEALFLILRMGRKKYVQVNAIVTVTLTIFSVLGSLVVNQVLCLIAFPIEGGESLNGVAASWQAIAYDKSYLFSKMEILDPYLYNICLMLTVAMISGAVALITYALTLSLKLQQVRYYMFGLLVYVAITLITVVCQKFEIRPLRIYYYFSPSELQVTNAECILTIFGMYLLGMILLFGGQKKYEYI